MYKKERSKWTMLLHKYRFMHGLSMEEMAKKVGLTTANYFEIEKCKRARPKLETFTMLAMVLDKPIEDLKKIYYESHITKK